MPSMKTFLLSNWVFGVIYCIELFTNLVLVKEKRHRTEFVVKFFPLFTRCHNMWIWRQWKDLVRQFWIMYARSYMCVWKRHANQDASLNTTFTCVILSKSYIHYFPICAQEVKQLTHTLLCCQHVRYALKT